MRIARVPDEQMPAEHDWLLMEREGEPTVAFIRASRYCSETVAAARGVWLRRHACPSSAA